MTGSIRAAAIALALLPGVIPLGSWAASSPSPQALDPDHDGTMSADEAKAAADRKFGAANADKDTTLEPGEVKGAVPAKTFRMADPDGDFSLDRAEWEALVQKRFEAADTAMTARSTRRN